MKPEVRVLRPVRQCDITQCRRNRPTRASGLKAGRSEMSHHQGAERGLLGWRTNREREGGVLGENTLK